MANMLSETVASRVRRLRKRQKLTVAQLADRCAAHGAPELTVAALYAIEGGRRDELGRRTRNVTVDEAHVLALALGVADLTS